MLSFKTNSDLEDAMNCIKSIDNNTDYLHDILYPAIQKGDWDELQEMVVYSDKTISIKFKEDEWEFRYSEFIGSEKADLIFAIDNETPNNVIELCAPNSEERQLINEIKLFAILTMYFTRKAVTLKSIQNNVSRLRKNATLMKRKGVFSFRELTLEMLSDWIDDGADFTAIHALTGLNQLYKIQGLLPFEINYPAALSHKKLEIKATDSEQHCVIPPRLYFHHLNTFSKAINNANKFRDEIEKAVEILVAAEQVTKAEAIDMWRCHGSTRHLKRNKAFLKALSDENIEFHDNAKDARWIKVFDKIQPNLNLSILLKGNNRFKPVQIAGVTFTTVPELRAYLVELNYQACYLCLALSGMRIDELYRMYPLFGAQTMDIDGATMYLLTTRQSKISGNTQTSDDVFVTTRTGYKAFQVLNSIHAPLRKLFKAEKNRFFASLAQTTYPFALAKNALADLIVRQVNNARKSNFTLTKADMTFINTSNPEQKVFHVGGLFRYTNHQLRRSLAYYLIGYELCAYPQLKQQFTHFSMAMTRYYARYAASYQKLYSEIQNERTVQHAEIFARIMNTIKNKERIAGGKAKAQLSEIAKQGEIYWEDGKNKQKLSRTYWEQEINDGRAHLHAIAPSMYCTNIQCSMRLNIDLSECVGCEFDYIEDILYAESSRMNAMRNVVLAIENGDMNANLASRFYVQIKAAETIMADLDFAYEPYDFPIEITNLLITTTISGVSA